MKNLKLQILLTIILIIINSMVYSQDKKKVDSLLTILKTSKKDTNCVNIYCKLSTLYVNSKLDSSLYYINQGLAIAIENQWTKGIPDCYYRKGTVYLKQGNHDNALFYYLKALKCAEEISDTSGICRCFNSIGLLHRAKKDFDKALYYFERSLELSENKMDKMAIAISNMNIGTIYQSQRKFEEANLSYLKALVIFEEFGDKSAIARCNGNIAITYLTQKKYGEAKKYLNKSLLFFEKANEKDGIINVLNNLVLISISMKEYNEAINYAKRGLSIAKEINALPLEEDIYERLTIAYDSMGNYKSAYENQKMYLELHDSIFNEESGKQFKEMEARYNAEKKQKEIELLEKDNRINAYEIKRQTFQKYVFIGGFGLMIILALVIFKSNRRKKKDNKLLAEQKFEIEEKNEELYQQNDEIRTHRDEIEKQKQHIENIHKELTDSIRYAERIQKAVLPGEQIIKEKINYDFFILFKPKDIVSGDFYFVELRKQWLLLAVADCTGHGVPGAFMSMLGISFLNEIIAKDDIHNASHVIDELRNHVIFSLQQKGISGEQKDGMDIAFVALNTETNELEFAGANNSMYLIPFKDQNQITEIKGDKMPVSIHMKMDNFTNHIFQLEKGDIIYLSSDGYADQFGGPNGRKFMYKQFKEVLLKNSKYPMPDQKEILDKTIEDWKNNYGVTNEQADDITLFGIKI